MQIKSILKNIKINIVLTLTTSVLNFLINKYFAEYLGQEMLGLMKFLNQMIMYLSIVDLGLIGASSYYLYEPLAKKDKNKINMIFNTISSIYNKIAIFILIAGLILAVFIKKFISFKTNISGIQIYWILYTCSLSISYLNAKYSILMTADQKIKEVKLIQIGVKIFFQIFQILIIIYLKEFIYFILLLILDSLFQLLIYKNIFKKSYFYIKKSKKIEKIIFMDMKKLFWHKLSYLIVFNTDYILIAKYVSLSAVGIYSSYLMIINMVLQLINLVTDMIIPIIGKYINTNSKEKNYAHWKKISLFYTYIAITFSIITYFSINQFIKLWLGNNFILNNNIKLFIILNLFAMIYRIPTDIFKTQSGFFDDIYTPILECIINFVISIILVREIGILGVILGTIVSNYTILLGLKGALVYDRCFKKSAISYLKYYLKTCILLGINFILVAYLLNRFKIFLEVNSWKEFIFLVLYLIIFTNFIYIIILIFQKENMEILRSIKQEVK